MGGQTRPECAHLRSDPALSWLLSAAGRSTAFRSCKISPLAKPHFWGGSWTRSRSVPDPLTKAPEPHHSTIPQDLTTSPAKLHLTKLKPLPDKALPWR